MMPRNLDLENVSNKKMLYYGCITSFVCFSIEVVPNCNAWNIVHNCKAVSSLCCIKYNTFKKFHLNAAVQYSKSYGLYPSIFL